MADAICLVLLLTVLTCVIITLINSHNKKAFASATALPTGLINSEMRGLSEEKDAW